jgi:hypothetical protein
VKRCQGEQSHGIFKVRYGPAFALWGEYCNINLEAILRDEITSKSIKNLKSSQFRRCVQNKQLNCGWNSFRGQEGQELMAWFIKEQILHLINSSINTIHGTA